MLTATMAFELKKDKILVVCINPGLVGTDMGNESVRLFPNIGEYLVDLRGRGNKKVGRPFTRKKY